MNSASDAVEAVKEPVKKLTKGEEEGLRKAQAREAWKAAQRVALGAVSDPKARFQAAAAAFMAHKQDSYMTHPKEKYCTTCWTVLRACICEKLQKITTRNHYITWLHYKEIWRTTNTGTLLPQSCENARTLIFGKAADDAELERVLKEESDRTVFLYPSSESISLREYFERKRTPEEGPIEDWEAFIKTAPPINVIGIDSTWSLSRAMSSGMPTEIPRVHLTDPPKFSISRMRNQVSAGRITTAEAFAWAMKELGETEEAVESLYYNLKVRCDATELLTGVDAKKEPMTSVANREIRQAANMQRRLEKRAERAVHAEKRAKLAEEASSSSTEPSNAAMDVSPAAPHEPL